ncbi:MAG: patatin-like phospholipase family protein [Gammaproteobacteria bacterium]
MNLYNPLILVSLLLVLGGCATSARITNTPVNEQIPTNRQQITTGVKGQRSDDAFFFISLSGGGTRAAALSYGVLQELRDTTYIENGMKRRLLDEIDYLSSVSGGSFTAAYYGLYGDRIFEDYETVFLRQNVQRTLINSVINPLNWLRALFTGFNRTEMAIDYYDTNIFKGGTFNDIFVRDGPFIDINATDLGIGARFSFTQERFNMLCSDVGEFKVARAVAASSAVPVAFAPITLQNFDTCPNQNPDWFSPDHDNFKNNTRIGAILSAYKSYQDKQGRPFIHLVDGGITDNLGIRALYDRVELMGGAKNAAKTMEHIPKYLVIIVVNAETRPENPMDSSDNTPSSVQVVDAVSSAQIGRFNIESLALLEEGYKRWAADLSTFGHTVTPFFIKLDFQSIGDQQYRRIFNNMATSFSLPNDEVDKLIEAGRTLLRQSPVFQELLQMIRENERKQARMKEPGRTVNMPAP